jgi:serine phosphatase RsbU (regulator of sigma subunit)/anti-sigma regulatory factor (Ser/Thr protein kinase)
LTTGDRSGTARPGRGQVFLGTGGRPALATRSQHLLGIYRLSDPSLSDLPLERLLDELLIRIREILSVDTAAVLLLDTETRELVARAAKGIEEEVEQGVRIPLGRGFAGRIANERMPIYIADVDHADVLNPILRAKGIRSLLGVPLMIGGRVLGVLHVGTLHPRVFTNADAAILQLAAGRAAPAIERAQLLDALEHEHLGAVALQSSLLPDVLPNIATADVAARYLPARDVVGGDWYDVLDLGDGRIGLAIGDVAGHGVRAAALMGQLRTALRAYALEGHPPGETLRRVDTLLHATRARGMATAAYAIVDPELGRLTIASAGHPPPLHVVGDGQSHLIDVAHAPPLGVLQFAQYDETHATIAAGDGVVLYTDGLIERRGVPLAENLERLPRVADAPVPQSADELCERVLEGMLPDGAARDDVAVVALRLEPLGPELHLRLPAQPEILAGMRRALRRWLRTHGAGDEDITMVALAAGEACANVAEHAYDPGPASFALEATIVDGVVILKVRDEGSWRESRGRNRGRGLMLMEKVMDEVHVEHSDGGTEVVMRRRLAG